MWSLTAKEVAELTGGACRGNEDLVVRRVSVDSREAQGAETLFVGLEGPRFEGSRFAGDALEKGASVVVVSDTHYVPEQIDDDQAVIVVDGGLDALQALAREARRRFRGTVVGITGSNGKTTVKEMLRTALGDDFRIAASPMSWNSQVGVALTLLNLRQDADIALIECGISKPGEMVRLRKMVQPDCGIFVNVGLAHRRTLIDAETTAAEKAQLFAELPDAGWVLVPAPERLAIEALRRVMNPGSIIHPNGQLEEVESHVTSGYRVRLTGDSQEYVLSDAAAVLGTDVELTVAAAERLGASAPDVLERLQDWQPAAMRLERLTTPEGVYVINDAYSADLESVRRAVQALEREHGDGRRMAIFAGLSQLGRTREATHRKIGQLVARSTIDRLIVVGGTAVEIAEAAVDAGFAEDAVTRVTDGPEAAELLREEAHPGDMVLVKGSRPAKLEKVVDLLLTPLSPARVYVDLDKLSENLDRLRGLVGPSVKLMPVVKSFGYGLDSRKLAETFEASGADYLGVAYPDEGVALRRHGIHLPIMVQNVLPHEASKVVEHRLDAQISDLDTARRLGAHAQAYGREVGLHLKVDTGMGRAGVLPRAARELAAALVEVPGCKLVGLMTHLAAADEEAHDEFTRAQIASFRELRDDLQDDGIEFEVVHAANSAGSVRFPESHFSMVRSGIGLVGYLDLDAPEESPFAPIIRFVSQVVGVRELPPGHPVGYGLSWRASEGHRRLAVVAVGYNDGYPRHLSNKGWMMIAGTRCPVVGKVCMDVTMVDISDVSDEVSLGDEVVVYGTEPEEPDLADMAALAGTIPYELLTRISPRVRRIYRRER